jgi:endonuclease/exonuclease/phosphatase (EEP) superfamily protein YafD
LAALSIAGLFGRWAWWLDLCAHFRWQYAASALLLGVAAALLRRGRLIMSASSILLFNGMLIWPTAPAGTSRSTDASTAVVRVSLVNANLWRDNPDLAAFTEWLGANPAQIVVLQELTPAHYAALHPLLQSQGLREVIVLPANDAFGIGVWSSLQVRSAQLRELGPYSLASIHAQLLTTDGLALDLFATHPLPPIGAAGTAARNAHLLELSAWVKEKPRAALVLAGDFNATPWSSALRDLSASLQLDAGTHLDWPTPSWKPRVPLGLGWLLAVPIDHVMLRGALLIEHQHAPDTGSDHRAQRVVMGVPKPAH